MGLVLAWSEYVNMDIEVEGGTLGGDTYVVGGRPICFSYTRSHTRAIRALNGGDNGFYHNIKDDVVDRLLEAGDIQINDDACQEEHGWMGCIVYDPEGDMIGRVGDRCTLPAGYNTDHLGTGRCHIHGGKDIARRAADKIRHGRTSKSLRHRVSGLVQKYLADPEPLNLRQELATTRALMESALDIVVDKGDLDAYMEAIPGLRNTIELIGRTANRLSQIEQRYAMTAGQMAYVQVTVVDLINTFIDDPIVREQAALWLMNRIGTPSNRITGG